MNKLTFTNKRPRHFIGQKRVFNFLNMESLWQFKNNPPYRKEILNKQNVNFPDGKMISRKLKISQVRGPTFTKEFLNRKQSPKEKHFFFGGISIEQILKNSNLSEKQIKAYNPPFVKSMTFGEKEIKKMTQLLKEFKPDFVWVGVGSPKQEILSNQLYEKYKTDYFSVGAALDFLVGNKKEAPKIWRIVGLEWLYQLIVHPKRAWKKVKRHFFAIGYLNLLELTR